MSDTKAKKPCAITVIGKNRKEEIVPPSVDCTYDCENCGWNPKEIRRRWANGQTLDENGLLVLRFRPNRH